MQLRRRATAAKHVHRKRSATTGLSYSQRLRGNDDISLPVVGNACWTHHASPGNVWRSIFSSALWLYYSCSMQLGAQHNQCQISPSVRKWQAALKKCRGVSSPLASEAWTPASACHHPHRQGAGRCGSLRHRGTGASRAALVCSQPCCVHDARPVKPAGGWGANRRDMRS